MLEIYIGYICLVVIHEFAHYMLLKMNNVDVLEITVGNLIHLRLGKLRISPFVASGNVVFSEFEFNKLRLGTKLCILFAGPSANMVAAAALSNIFTILSSIGLFMAMLTLMPVPFMNTDGWNIVEEIYKHFFKKNLN